MAGNWTPTALQHPDRDRLIIWISPGGEEVRGRFIGGYVWMPEGSDCYVYYTPTFWRYADA